MLETLHHTILLVTPFVAAFIAAWIVLFSSGALMVLSADRAKDNMLVTRASFKVVRNASTRVGKIKVEKYISPDHLLR
jgi:hypothetical protein